MNDDCIEVSLFCPGCALFEYVIKRDYVSTDKRLNLTCAVTYRVYVDSHSLGQLASASKRIG